jgi:phosphate transport system ATP-binding protein
VSTTVAFAKIVGERQGTGRSHPDLRDHRIKVEARGVNFWYGQTQALFDINMSIPERCVAALIGPSGCGKSTFLRTMNRMNELIDGTRHAGEIYVAGEEIHGRGVDVVRLRKRVGMVFQKSNPSPA